MDTSALFDATALAAVVAFLVSVVKPFCEAALPWCRDTQSQTHDATLRLLNVALNVGLVLAIAASQHQLTGSSWMALALQGLAQAAGSQALYHTVTRSGAQASGAAPTSASQQPVPLNVTPLPVPQSSNPSAAEVLHLVETATQAQARVAA